MLYTGPKNQTRTQGRQGASRAAAPANRNFRNTDFVSTIISDLLPSTRNQLLKLAYDQYIGTLKKKQKTQAYVDIAFKAEHKYVQPQGQQNPLSPETFWVHACLGLRVEAYIPPSGIAFCQNALTTREREVCRSSLLFVIFIYVYEMRRDPDRLQRG